MHVLSEQHWTTSSQVPETQLRLEFLKHLDETPVSLSIILLLDERLMLHGGLSRALSSHHYLGEVAAL